MLTGEKCSSSRIPALLSCCFNFPRNVEMDVPGLGSLSAVFRAAQSRLALRQGAALAAKPPLPQLRHGQGCCRGPGLCLLPPEHRRGVRIRNSPLAIRSVCR